IKPYHTHLPLFCLSVGEGQIYYYVYDSRLLVGAPFESTGKQQTGDVYRCPLDTRNSANCSRLNLGILSLDNISERKDKMRLGMTLTSNPKDNSFVTCGPLWSHECGSSLYSTGICSRVNRNFRLSHTIAPALQRCETLMDIVIVLDGSNSIYPWYEVQDFIINILHKFYIGPGQTQVGVVQYASTVVHEFSLDEYQTVVDVVEAARNINQRGGEETRTALGINVARSEAFKRGGRPGAHKVMIVITDGESHDSPELVQAVTDSKRANITMYAIAVLGYYNRRGINPEAFLKEIKFIASDPDEKHFFKVTDESALKDIVDALGERIFSLEGHNQGRGYSLQMAQAGFSSHLVKDGVLLGAVGAYDWNGAVLKETKHGKVVPPKSSYQDEFPDVLKNHAAYLGYSVGSLISARGSQLYVAGAPRFNHTGKVIVFTLKNTGNLTILQALLGEQIGSYFGSELLSMDVDSDGHTDCLLVAAPMYYSHGWERGKVYIYSVTPQTSFVLQGVLELSDCCQNSRLGSALAQIPDMNGDGFRELAVGAPLEDDHQGAVYIFYGQDKTTQPQYRQRLSAASFSAGLQYFGQSLHGVLDVNADGLVDLAVGALGAAVIIWSRSVVQIQAKLTFEPQKVNIFNKDCQQGGKEVTCMSLTVCLSLDSKTKIRTDIGRWNKHTNISVSLLQFCSMRERATCSLCIHEKSLDSPVFIVESGRRRMVVFAQLENQGENAYRAAIHISFSPNLLFSSLLIKVPKLAIAVSYQVKVYVGFMSWPPFPTQNQSDIQIECYAEERLASQRNCNITAPFMKSLAKVGVILMEHFLIWNMSLGFIIISFNQFSD
uniref:VWFA domain-containing protein n=1 Tax=Amphiprion ocellaris TaxID=80972 RepID=A0AAQ5ZX90_AMPOC